MELISRFWQNYLVHAVDIIIVAYIFYRLMLLIKGTRAVQVLVGTIVLLIATFLADNVFHFVVLGWLLRNFWVASVIVLAVVFQPELRNALAQLGSQRLTRLLIPSDTTFINEIIETIIECSKKKIGMLIGFEVETGLREHIETGTILNSEISKELILTIFNPKSVLHDGAIIIQNGRLIAAGCVLPLSPDTSIAKVLGTRHRAAIGLTEISDAWVVVVSEETGKVSLARQGQLEQGIGIESLKQQLIDLSRSRQEKGLFFNRFTGK